MAFHAVTLRPACLADARAMSLMSRDLIEAGLAWRYSASRIAALMRERETMGLVACDASAIQGFAVMQFGDEHAHLVLLCVRPSHQRAGIGRRLVEWLLESARVAGIESVHLELRADNEPALTFYRGLGFVATVRVEGYYEGKVAAWRMVRALRGDGAQEGCK